jgi:hypothetical protein
VMPDLDPQRWLRSLAGTVAGDAREPTDFGLFGSRRTFTNGVPTGTTQLLQPVGGTQSHGPDTGVRRAWRGGAWRHAYTMCV